MYFKNLHIHFTEICICYQSSRIFKEALFIVFTEVEITKIISEVKQKKEDEKLQNYNL